MNFFNKIQINVKNLVAVIARKKSIIESNDDGIDYQWGDIWIDSDDVLDIGGKYWRQNPDGSITEFTPPDLQFKFIKSNLINILGIEDFTILNGYRIRFKTENIAKEVVREFCGLFWTRHHVSAHNEGRNVIFSIHSETLEITYFPAVSDNNKQN